MKKPLTLSEIAIGIFALLLICTFALQLNLNRSSGNKVVAQTIVTYDCPIDGEEYTVPPRCVQVGAISTDAYGRTVKCQSNCQTVLVDTSTPKPDNPGCCVFDPTKKTVAFEPNTSLANCPTSTVEDLALISKT
ncbi:MAG: hypothetical protein PHS73_00085 [Candidatus Peribacteraceae bacterium]|nr:hypothetical protein [Candidatus Peribacteraceae bacterium]